MKPIPTNLPGQPITEKWWKSWTLWVNTVAAVAFVGDLLAGTGFISPVIMVPTMAVINNLLRFLKTKSKLVL